MRQQQRAIALAMTALMLAAIAQAKSIKKDSNSSDPEPEARAYVFSECFVSKNLPEENAAQKSALDIVSSFVPTLVATGYNAITSALKKAGEDNVEDQKFAGAPFYLYHARKASKAAGAEVKVSPRLGCVVLVHGVFDTTKVPLGIQNLKPKSSCKLQCQSAKAGDCEQCLQQNSITVTKLQLLYEAEVHFSEDQSAFTYNSLYFQVRDWLGNGRANRDHSYVMTLSLAGPGGKKDDDNVLSTAVIDLGKRELGKIYTAETLPGSTGWLGGLGLADTDKERVKDLGASKQKEIEKNELNLRPATLLASTAETAKGSAFAKKLGEILAGAKDDATKAIADTIDPSKIKERNEKKASDLEDAKAAEEKSFGAYLDAKIADDKADKPIDSEKAKLTANLDAARRSWCRDFNALKSQGVTPAGARLADCGN